MNKIQLFLFVVMLFQGCQKHKHPDSYYKLFDVKKSYTIPVPLNEPISLANEACLNAALHPTGREFYFSVWNKDNTFTVYKSEFKNGQWSKPVIADFSKSNSNVDVCLSPLDSSIFFISDRNISNDTSLCQWNIYKTSGNGEVHSLNLDSFNYDQFHPTISEKGNLYFTSFKGGSHRDIYVIGINSGKKHTTNQLPFPPNTEFDDGDVAVSPDEGFLITKINSHPESLGAGDLFISYKLDNGKWAEPKNMGNTINSEYHEYSPSISPDGEFLFFTRVIDGKGRIMCAHKSLFFNG